MEGDQKHFEKYIYNVMKVSQSRSHFFNDDTTRNSNSSVIENLLKIAIKKDPFKKHM